MQRPDNNVSLPQGLTAIVQQFVGAHLGMTEPFTQDLAIEAMLLHGVARDYGVDLAQVAEAAKRESVTSASGCVYVGLVIAVEEFFDIELPQEALEAVQTWGDLQNLIVAQVPNRLAIEAMYQQRPEVITEAIEQFVVDWTHSPSLLQIVQTFGQSV